MNEKKLATANQASSRWLSNQLTCTVAFNPKALTATMMFGFPANLKEGSRIISFSLVSYTFIPGETNDEPTLSNDVLPATGQPDPEYENDKRGTRDPYKQQNRWEDFHTNKSGRECSQRKRLEFDRVHLVLRTILINVRLCLLSNHLANSLSK